MRYFLILFVIFTLSCSKKPKEEEKESRKEEIALRSEQSEAELVGELKKQKENKKVVQGQRAESVKSQAVVRERTKKKEIIYPPKIQYISYSFEELKGNIDGVIDAGDRIRLNINVKNIGRGPTSATSAKVSTSDKIVIAMTEVILPYIANGETKSFPLDINIPSIAPESAKVLLEFSEGSKAEISFKIKARQKTSQEQKIGQDKERLKKKREERFNDLDKAIE